MKWLLSGLLVVFVALAAYCFVVSREAQKVMDAVNGPPVLQAQIDFSKPFTNEFRFRQTVQPFYGTMYLTLNAEPWPKGWTKRDIAEEDLRNVKGELRVISAKGDVETRDLNWYYYRFPEAERSESPLQAFFGRLPLGEYQLLISTTAGVRQLENARQELIVRYDFIHERPIAKGMRVLGVSFGTIASIVGLLLIYLIRRRPNAAKP